MKDKFIDAFMDIAERFAKLSTARRLQVGAVIVKDDCIIAHGYNGTPSGWDNNCEIEMPDGSLKTSDDVIHAEDNAIGKLAKSTNSGTGATMFITHAPCRECAKIIATAGITRVIFRDIYRDLSGIEHLEKRGVKVVRLYIEESFPNYPQPAK